MLLPQLRDQHDSENTHAWMWRIPLLWSGCHPEENMWHRHPADDLHLMGWLPARRALQLGEKPMPRSHPPLGWRPDELVHLELKADIETIGQDPFHDFARIDSAENRRKQNGVTTLGKIEL